MTSASVNSSTHAVPPQFDLDELLSINEIIAILRRHKQLIAVCIVIGIACAMIYIFFAQPRFSATTSILIDPRQQNMLSDLLGGGFSIQDNFVIDSHIEVIRSTKLLEKAAKRAGIYNNLQQPSGGFLDSIKEALFGDQPASEIKHLKERMRTARLNAFKGGLSVNRVKGTFVIDITYTSGNAEMSARRANLIADTYLDNELEAQYEASQRTNQWLKTRLKKLQQNLAEAERAVERFREENNLIQTANRGFISDQQLSELNSRLIMARTEATQAKARYDRIQTIIQDGDPNSITSDLLNNGVIVSLRSKYIELSRLANEIKRKQGVNHQAYLNLKRQMEDIQQIILNEYERIAESYKNEYEIAESKLASLKKEVDSVTDTTMVSRRNQVELRELQRRAESTRNLYTKMLDNFNEQTERQSVPLVHARIISYASVPLSPSWPNNQLILVIGMILGAGAGVALAFFREQFDKFIWKVEELEAITHRTCLGMLPKIAFDTAKLGHLSKSKPKPVPGSKDRFNSEGLDEVTQLLNKQTSVTTEIMRNIQLAVQFKKHDTGTIPAKVISFVSARPSEGKSLTSCFLAKHLAKTGARVVLVDCDFRRPSLTHWFTPKARYGFYELASQLHEQSDLQYVREEIGNISYRTGEDPLFFIPAKGANTSIANLNLVSSGQMNQLIQLLQLEYDAILIDLPPIINIVDARMIASSVDSFIFLAQWGKTDRDLVKKALHRAPEVFNKTVGTLLTLVDTEKAGSYGYYNYNYYYHR